MALEWLGINEKIYIADWGFFFIFQDHESSEGIDENPNFRGKDDVRLL